MLFIITSDKIKNLQEFYNFYQLAKTHNDKVVILNDAKNKFAISDPQIKNEIERNIINFKISPLLAPADLDTIPLNEKKEASDESSKTITEDSFTDVVEKIIAKNSKEKDVAIFTDRDKHIELKKGPQKNYYINSSEEIADFLEGLKEPQKNYYINSSQELADFLEVLTSSTRLRLEDAEAHVPQEQGYNCKTVSTEVANFFISLIAVFPNVLNSYLRPSKLPPPMLLEAWGKMTGLQRMGALSSAGASLLVNLPANLVYTPEAILKYMALFSKIGRTIKKRVSAYTSTPAKNESEIESIEESNAADEINKFDQIGMAFGTASALTLFMVSFDSTKESGRATQWSISIVNAIPNLATRTMGSITVLKRLFDPDTKRRNDLITLLKRLQKENHPDINNLIVDFILQKGDKAEITAELEKFFHELITKMDEQGIEIPTIGAAEFAGKAFDTLLALAVGYWIAPVWAAKGVEGLELMIPILKYMPGWANIFKLGLGYTFSWASTVFYMLNVYDIRQRALNLSAQIGPQTIEVLSNLSTDLQSLWQNFSLSNLYEYWKTHARDPAKWLMAVPVAESGVGMMEVAHEVVVNKMIPCLNNWITTGSEGVFEWGVFTLTDLVNASIILKFLYRPLNVKYLEETNLDIAIKLLEQDLVNVDEKIYQEFSSRTNPFAFFQPGRESNSADNEELLSPENARGEATLEFNN